MPGTASTGETMKLVGYADRLSAQPGDEITFMVSSESDSYSAELVRLIHGDVNPAGPGYKAEDVDSSFEGQYSGAVQPLRLGSCLRIPDEGALSPAGDFTLQMWIHPTTPAKDMQTLVSRRGDDDSGFALRLEEGRLTLSLGAARVSTEHAVHERSWYFVAAVYDASAGRARLLLEQCSGVVVEPPELADGALEPSPASGTGDLLVAAEPAEDEGGERRPGSFYNGKIDSPRLYDRALSEVELAALRDGGADEVAGGLVAAWDLSLDISNWTVTDVSGHSHHGTAVNKPLRGVTGRNWEGTVMGWPDAPQQYGAIHFHDDDLADAGWEPAFTWTVPGDLPSGFYAARISSGDDEDIIPFAICPRLGKPQADIALVLPTFSWLAYADEQMANNGTLAGQVDDYPRLPEDAYIVDNGLRSLYDRHSDGSGVYYSTWLRPLVNMRPKYTQAWLDNGAGSPHQLPADLHVVDWLVESGYSFDVLTDLELHRDGARRLEDYRVVLTGTHAEYTSAEMLDGYETYLNGGGRLMYLSGNGMFFITQLDPDTETSIEIRRAGLSMWVWPNPPGEFHLSSTGEMGGLWSGRGRGPHAWLGVGMNSEGGGPGRPYARESGSFDPRAAFIFEGVGDDELIGDFPALVSSWGAAGFEVDWADRSRGTPDHTLLLASAEGFGPEFELNAGVMAGGAAQHPPVRADMAMVEYPNGGAVFSTGSISWCACLSYNGYDNNVSRVTRNVLDGFLAEALPGSSDLGS